MLFPPRLGAPLLKVAAVLDGVIDPLPALPGVHFEPHKRLAPIEAVQFERASPFVEGWMVGSSRKSRSALLLATFFPVPTIGQIGPHFANGILDDTATVHKGHSGERLREVPARPGVGMLFGCDATGFGPGQQLVGTDRPLPHFQMLFRIVGNALCQLVGMGQKEVDVEGPRLGKHLDGGIEESAFFAIGSSLVALVQGKRELGGACRVSHAAVLLMRTNVLDASSILPLRLLVKLFRSS